VYFFVDPSNQPYTCNHVLLRTLQVSMPKLHDLQLHIPSSKRRITESMESTVEHWRVLESTGEHWRALESTG
jgi:hypothetical protein